MEFLEFVINTIVLITCVVGICYGWVYLLINDLKGGRYEN